MSHHEERNSLPPSTINRVRIRRGRRQATIVLSGVVALFSSGCTGLKLSKAIQNSDDLIAAHVQAIGGMENLRALRSRTSYGVYEEPKFRQNHRCDEKRPNLIRITTNYNRETGTYGYCEGFDGAAWEYSFGAPKRVTGMPAKALRRASEFDATFIDYQYKGHAVEWKGKVRLLDRDVYRLRLGEADYFFDTNSFMVVMQRAVVPFHGEGKEDEIITMFSDFRPVEGILMPHRVQQQRRSGEIMSTLTWTEIQGNVEIPDDWFSPPLSPAQKQFELFRQNALAGDLGDLTSSYLRYEQRSEEDLNQQWENELNTLGYELMSHERYDRAIAVFRLAVEKFPKSSNLYDSLGEVYMVAGDNEQSLQNYRRSVELNPDNEHAVKMIKRLKDPEQR